VLNDGNEVLPFALRPSKSDAKPHQNPRATIHRVQSTVAQTANPGSQLIPSPRALRKALHGVERNTMDIDVSVVVSPHNLARLTAAARERVR
jgi:hypothetical protein